MSVRYEQGPFLEVDGASGSPNTVTRDVGYAGVSIG